MDKIITFISNLYNILNKPTKLMTKQPTEKHCYNCDSILPESAIYCSNCGQKHTTDKIPLYELVFYF